jgi:hypothetical protein
VNIVDGQIASVDGIAVGDTVVCTSSFGRKDAPQTGEKYVVSKFTSVAGDYYLWPEGLAAPLGRVSNFKKFVQPGAAMGTTTVSTEYLLGLERDRLAINAACTRQMYGESSVEAVRRVVAENETLRRENAGLRSMKHINPEYVKELEAIKVEHRVMKRQLELAESYNYDAVGTTDGSALYDLNNYVLAALGKPKMPLHEWLMKQVGRAMKRLSLKPWKTPVFDERFTAYDLIKPVNISNVLRNVGIFDYDLKYEGDKVDIRFRVPAACDYIPITFVITDEKTTATGCAEGCSHPDCKKATK